MTKKYYRIDINTTSTTWETCECYVEAESEEEARAIFDKDPYVGEWDNWETQDGELRDWDVERVEYDEWMTIHMADPEKSSAQIKKEIQEWHERRATEMAEERIKETKDEQV